MKVRLAEMSWPEVKEALSKPNIVILPMGSTEQHGTQLPLNVDSATATYLAEHAAQKVADENGISALVAPTIDYTDVSVHKMFPGTIGIKVDTLIRIIADIVESFLDQGFSNILALNSHFQNRCSMEAAFRIVADRHPEANLFAVCSIGLGIEIETDENIIKAGLTGMGHALEVETSQSLVIQPQNVHLDKAGIGSRKLPLSEKYIGATGMDNSKGVIFHPGAKGFEKTGTQGDPTKASRELGEKILSVQLNAVAEIIVQIIKGKKE